MKNKLNPSLFKGYHIISMLYDGIQSQVYKAIREYDQRPVILKTSKQNFPSFNELLKFRNQFTLIKDLDIDGIVKPLSLNPYQDKLLLVMPDDDSIDLQQYLNSAPLQINKFLVIAIAMAKILDQLYAHQIIHKDIKPNNIIINPKSEQCQLIDFSIAIISSKEVQTFKSLNVLEGTLAYMPPEQTSRMNRGVDYRSDFYSLGVTFYQMLTGQLPFKGKDAMELVHCHLAKLPKPPILINPDIPQAINNIIVKLMEKNAEDRYQSAEGLLYDLDICQQQWLQCGKIERLKLGQHDIARKFSIPEKLYGRTQQVHALLNMFRLVSQGQPALLLVVGAPGIGKTALVNEIHQSIVRERGYFIKGKYDQYNRSQPFLALIQAMRMLILQLLNESPDAVSIWQTRFQSTLGSQAAVLITLIPELEQLTGKQSIAVALEGNAETLLQHSFLTLFQIITQHHPLVMFLDDLQWIDVASLQLLPILMRPDSAYPLLLIGAYRNNEVASGHPLLSVLKELKQRNLINETIELTALLPEHLEKMVMDVCLCGQTKASELAELIYQKTQGNPFFTHRFMAVLYEEKLVKFDYKLGQWCFDLPQIAQLAESDDVVKFMVSRIKKLNSETQTILQLAACMGNQFDLKTLAVITSKTLAECAAILWQAMQENLIIALTDDYKLFLDTDLLSQVTHINVLYQFSHDRVQQAAYIMIPPDNKTMIHLTIGELLQEYEKDMESPTHLLEITNQLNLGSELISDQSKRLALAILNHQSGRKAKSAAAYIQAGQYYAEGIRLLSEQCWQHHYDLSLVLHEDAAEVACLMGDYDVMHVYKAIIMDHAKTLLETVNIQHLYCLELIAKAQITKVMEYVVALLNQLGCIIPINPTQSDTQCLFDELQILLKKETNIDQHSKMVDKRALAITRLIIVLMPVTHDTNPRLFSFIIMVGIKLSLQYGNAPNSVLIYGNYGQILISQYHDTESGYQYGKLSLKLLKQFNSIELTAQAHAVVYGTIFLWKEPLNHAITPSKMGYQSGFEAGDYLFASVNIVSFVMSSYYSGVELAQLDGEMHEYYHAIEIMQQTTFLHWHNIFHQSILNLLGPALEPWKLQGNVFNEDNVLPKIEECNDQFAICLLYLNKMILGYLFQQKLLSQASLIYAEKSLDAVMGTINVAVFHFYAALIRLDDYVNNTHIKQQSILEQVADHLQKMKNWAKHAPMNFQHKYDLIEAERCRVTGDWLAAEAYYEKAIQAAQKNEYIQEAALANELAGCFFLARNNKTIAKMYMTQAYYAYANWGAKAKTDDLEARYPDLLSLIMRARNKKSMQDTTTSDTHLVDQLDISSVLKSSQTLSSELSLSKLLEQMLTIVMENAGAQRSILLLNDDDVWVMAGECRMDTKNRALLLGVKLAEVIDLPQMLVDYVINKEQVVVLENAQDNHQRFHDDPYFARCTHVKSVLCKPILSQAKVMGLLYLENTLIEGAFDEQRLQMLDMLSTQAAISIENAHLYETLEEKVAQRTEELKAAQVALVKQAKEAGMAEIAIGVMHNIGNALTPAKTNLEASQQQILNSPLRHSLEQALAKLPTVIQGATTLNDAEKNRLSHIIQVLPQAIAAEYDYVETEFEKIQKKHEHIEKVIQLQMKYAKVTDFSESVDFNKLVLDALQMLSDSIKKHDIQVVTDFDEIPEIQSDESKLLQILLNVIKNACESMANITTEPRRLALMTQLDETASNRQLICQIKDNGIGFAVKEETLFGFGYTTKTRGLGFGLHTCGNDIKVLKGSIEAFSGGQGQGAIFTIRLPVA